MAAFALKAGLTPITSLMIQTHEVNDIATELAQKAKQAPKMFERLPCVLDFSQLPEGQEISDLRALYLTCREFGLLPIGVRCLQGDFTSQLEELGLSDFGNVPSGTKNPVKTKTSEPSTDADKTPEAVKCPPTIHRFPVRSGQQIRAEGDLIIYGLVSAGAEVLAGGNITVFGPLRGRALAGLRGDQSSTISCQSLEAELVAIAGEYKLFEEQHQDPKPACILLEDGRLNILNI